MTGLLWDYAAKTGVVLGAIKDANLSAISSAYDYWLAPPTNMQSSLPPASNTTNLTIPASVISTLNQKEPTPPNILSDAINTVTSHPYLSTSLTAILGDALINAYQGKQSGQSLIGTKGKTRARRSKTRRSRRR
jgi:hypothetical protein